MTATIATRTLDAPGATITYDVRGTLGAATPLLLIGSPMDASGFVTLAGHFTDRPVITYDPRGTARSPRSDGHGELTPAQHADDLRRVVEAIGGGPVDVLASSGGAVNALAWVTAHPSQIRTLVAHEPPLAALTEDTKGATAAVEDIYATYQRDGLGPGMAKFIMIVSHPEPLAEDFAFPPVDPAQFGLPAADDGSRDDVLMQNLRNCTGFRPDLEALRSSTARIVIARGAASGQELAARGADAVAAAAGLELVVFPGGHAGFAGGEFGQMGEPDGFAAALREVLDRA